MNTRECVVNFIRNLTNDDKSKMYTMLSHGIMCGINYAKENDVDPILFNQELKNVLGGKV